MGDSGQVNVMGVSLPGIKRAMVLDMHLSVVRERKVEGLN